ncbi:hypothetical protein AUEXF2481DRAFT_645597 [Aureobasidium subglaciale EXF-2481]|uniref:DNA (cytosine-5-)-methyltransferase n=1 Tax=Aureobasidium subglaciale (strain EXF-2481) TaxID=1043005 RepID=A0A074YFR0_AURSE|nr:uncharacterized protein AUEXF2481DRAFT_645597 [Aureobasidium subglaciale EXF-2481]KAI5201037.1 S-adenosyl-L-methionine-dependent methyltransferase [Aureobasidium subglaciale]KAI5219673.1 S-adenosyl-L-methionine-dependent methyltransferase [Aureobasidium subglaciale]KAI5223398.1 S-adenosyl-L-methionine-dependent methyltransferase [Aureobasidium subglaciale]KAI5260446.1 S-adenosyl-L-methionine-dependent methyltransferase [Aureobasidium subglaciale]KEQ96575.1 hypothetical protein AUEXF2481DRAF
MRRSSSTVPGRAGTPQQPILIDDDIDTLSTNLYDAITVDDDNGFGDDDTADVKFISEQKSTIDNDTANDDVTFISQHGPIRDDDYRWGSLPPPRPNPRTSKRVKRAFVKYEPRTNPVTNTSALQGHWITDNYCLLPGLVVELRVDPGSPLKCGDFLRIVSIFEDMDSQSVYLRGILYRRTRTLDGMLPRKTNEVYQVLQRNMEDPRDIKVQSLHDIPVSLVTGTRCLKHTNTIFPVNSYRTREDMSGQSSKFICDNAQLTCRWKRTFQYSCLMDLMTGHPQETALERITDAECDLDFRIPDFKLREAVPNLRSDLSVIDLTADEAADRDSLQLADILSKTHISASTTCPDYTFADFFCGAGGISVGARQAGFKVVYGVDHNADACATYRLNFPGTDVFEEDVYYNLTARQQDNAHVRCCHMSTVCKTISTAYTVRGKNHDANEATLFCISDILRKATPMVATLEQTFGALFEGKKQIFNSFVLQFTDMNYSVKWAVHTLSEYGVPQARKRLIMLASCAGHPLPEFPKPTHAAHPEKPVPGLKPSVTIADALGPIRHDTPNHDPRALERKDFPPYSPHQLGRGCITTSGGQNNWHFSGKRHLTEREFACLQTFPLDFRFIGNRTSVIQQVGNAVPPTFSEKLYTSIRKTLDEVDAQDTKRIQEDREPTMVLDDEDEKIVMDLDV